MLDGGAIKSEAGALSLVVPRVAPPKASTAARSQSTCACHIYGRAVALSSSDNESRHFFVAGPNNVFDLGNYDWALPFKISVAILLFLELAGLSAAGRIFVR